jgi:hypothetical protein
MALINEWRVWCNTDNVWKTVFMADGASPTHCPDGHTVDTVKGYVRGQSTEVVAFDGDGNQLVSAQPSAGTEKYLYTPNLCDKLSWYGGATQIQAHAMTNTGDNTTFQTNGNAHLEWIDLKHGRMFKEDQILAAQPDLAVKVEVQYAGAGPWVEVSENSWGQSDNDYSVDYAAGTVTFNSALAGGDLVRASFWKANTSLFVVGPSAGKRLKLMYVEVQYTTDIAMAADLIFGIFGNVEVFAPELWDGYTPPGPYPAGTKIPLVEERYKRMQDFYQESTGPFPVIPDHGGDYVLTEVTGTANIETKLNEGYEIISISKGASDWEALMKVRSGDRAMKHPLVTIPFNYLAYRDLRSSYGMELRIQVDGDQEISGEFASVTFYCLTEDE